MELILSWFKESIARILLLAFIVISVVPIIIISILFIRQSMDALTAQMEANLQLLAEAKAQEINIKLEEVQNTTEIAARQASYVLQEDLDDGVVRQKMARYQPDTRNILGLDIYYSANGGAETLGENLSNVYWDNSVAPDELVMEQIIQTEQLDPVFDGIKRVSPDTQWVYLTTPEGMMRLYPWASNDHYPDIWDPREIIFYTIADPSGNPSFETRWTPPYVDFAGAGWMVTVSAPIVTDEAEYLGIMSHDITIDSLQEIALSIQVLDKTGYGFLINSESGIIAHPQFQDADASKGTQEEARLLGTGSSEYQALIGNMVAGQTGLGYYMDTDTEHLLVYAPVPATGWSLGITVPREQVIAPAIAMRDRAIAITGVLVVTAVALAIFLTRYIHSPLLKLIQGVHQVSEDRRADEIKVDSFDEFNRLAAAFNDMAVKVWEREENLKRKVATMRIQIDAQRKQKQLESIVETDFFKRLELNASQLRENIKGAGD